jgi:hypothetical protein
MKQCAICNSIHTSKWYSGPTCRKCYRKKKYQNPKQKVKNSIKCKKWHEQNKEYSNLKCKEYYQKNKNNRLQYEKLYNIKNRHSINERKRYYYQLRYSTDIGFRLKSILRSRLLHALKKNQKIGSAISDLGCTISKLKFHLQMKFHRNSRGKHEYMSWENYGEWHIDHIRPLSSFDLSNPEQIKVACHYTNLQPLWAKDNLKKGTTI